MGDGSANFVSVPVAWLRKTVYGSVQPRAQLMLEQDADLPASYVPLDVILTSPLLAIGLGLVAAPLVAIRLLAVAILESPRAVMNTLKMVSRTQKVGCLGKAVFYPLCGSMPLLLLAVSPVWGVFAGLYPGYLTAWSAMVSKTPIDFISRPVDDLVLAFSGIAGWVWNMLEGEMEDGLYVRCLRTAPFGAAGLLQACPSWPSPSQPTRSGQMQ